MQMNWIYTPYAAVLHSAALLAFFLAILILFRRKTPGASTFSLLMLAVAEWSLTSGFEAASVALEDKIFWSKFEYVGAVLAPTLFLIFTLEYRQLSRFLSPGYIILYSVLPLTALALTVTNEFHGLIWTGFTPSPEGMNSIIYHHGIGYYVLFGYSYLLILAGMLILSFGLRYTKPPYRQQIYLLLFGAALPILSGLLYTLGIDLFPGLDIIPVSFLITGVITSISILQFRLFSLLPVARHAVIEHMNDGVLVVDMQNLLADINPAAEKFLGIQSRSVLGQPIEQVMPKWFALTQQLAEVKEAQIELKTDETPPRYFEVRIRPLYGQKELTGRLIVFHESTLRRKAEKELSHQNEELSIINRINLAVAAGLDMEQTIKTLHEQCSLVVPIDIFYVALYDESRALISVPVHYERGRYRSGIVRDINENPGTLGSIIRSRQTLYLRDNIRAVTRPLNVQSDTEKRARSYVGIPLTVRDKIVGIMSIQSYRPMAYRDDQIHLLERIAVHAAIAIENARLHAEVQRLAIVDELTNIYNYRGLLELGKREVERAHRFNHPLAALFFDIDRFRDFNNRYSHSTGNIVLQAVARAVTEILRSVDIFARFGGDEFAILLPETDLEGCRQMARRIYEHVASQSIPTAHGNLSITISIGVSVLGNDSLDFNSLIENANKAEHIAKAQGMGVSVYGENGL
jgi:diguanylate cyclase (GGDEF)-like protein/PAS domain S-box-containing protein